MVENRGFPVTSYDDSAAQDQGQLHAIAVRGKRLYVQVSIPLTVDVRPSLTERVWRFCLLFKNLYIGLHLASKNCLLVPVTACK